jgi:hypothetical protein
VSGVRKKTKILKPEISVFETGKAIELWHGSKDQVFDIEKISIS